MPQPHMTRADQQRWNLSGILMLAAAAGGWSFGAGLASALTGQGWRPAYPAINAPLIEHPNDPLLIHRPDVPIWLWAICGFLVAFPLAFVAIRMTRPRAEERHKGLARWSDVRRLLSARAVRRAAKFTRPDLDRRARRRAPLTDLGYRLGRMRGTRHQLWASFEIRVRIIARTGWGKTSRLLVWIARGLPGAALIASTKPDLFEQTVRARQRGPRLPRRRWPLTGDWIDPETWALHPDWRPWTRDWWKPVYGPGRRVLVVDFSERANRYAAGFERLHWNPIPGCRDWQIALRRARGLVAGADDGERNGHSDKEAFFRKSASEVIAAWWHAADLGGRTMADVVRWMRDPNGPEAKDILDTHPAAQKAAWQALNTHLDPEGERTTSSVKRFVFLAMGAFATRDGEEFATGDQADIAELIEEQATIYLLASAATAPAVAPILAMFADEWFYGARQVAITEYAQYGRRLPVPAVGVLDELPTLVPISCLPEVAYEMRAYGIGVVYAVQNEEQEKALYGQRAASLAQNVQYTVVGGYDGGIVDELIAQAGPVQVTNPTASGSPWDPMPDISDGTQWRDVLTARDLQILKAGDALARVAEAAPFFVHIDSFRDRRHWRLRRQITREEASVRRDVKIAQAIATAQHDTWLHTAETQYGRRAS